MNVRDRICLLRALDARHPPVGVYQHNRLEAILERLRGEWDAFRRGEIILDRNPPAMEVNPHDLSCSDLLKFYEEYYDLGKLAQRMEAIANKKETNMVENDDVLSPLPETPELAGLGEIVLMNVAPSSEKKVEDLEIIKEEIKEKDIGEVKEEHYKESKVRASKDKETKKEVKEDDMEEADFPEEDYVRKSTRRKTNVAPMNIQEGIRTLASRRRGRTDAKTPPPTPSAPVSLKRVAQSAKAPSRKKSITSSESDSKEASPVKQRPKRRR